jgi:hypothetical protein
MVCAATDRRHPAAAETRLIAAIAPVMQVKKCRPEGEGTVCNATGINPPSTSNDIDYLLAYPNPAKENVHLRFVLNRFTFVSIELYNSEGSLVSRPFSDFLGEAVHDIPINLGGLQEGLYMVKMQAGEKTIFRKVVVL